ncbi:MAG: hypothetical protein JXR95_09710 [Deltaproteobacteria bacterium]|nr:hypothetical protein [Deltaproteobacteria bacterium]
MKYFIFFTLISLSFISCGDKKDEKYNIPVIPVSEKKGVSSSGRLRDLSIRERERERIISGTYKVEDDEETKDALRKIRSSAARKPSHPVSSKSAGNAEMNVIKSMLEKCGKGEYQVTIEDSGKVMVSINENTEKKIKECADSILKRIRFKGGSKRKGTVVVQ